MALPGLISANNLGDVASIEATWDNLGDGVQYTFSGVTTITIKGKDIFALNNVRNASVRDFVLIKGLTALVQPRLTTAIDTASATVIAEENSLLKASGVSSGTFFISRGALTASGLRVNGTPLASLSTSPFSGSTALFPIVLSSLKLSAIRWTPAMSSGVLSSPDKAIPIETDQFILFIKAGPN